MQEQSSDTEDQTPRADLLSRYNSSQVVILSAAERRGTQGFLYQESAVGTVMLPAHFHDVTDDKSRSGNLIWCRSPMRNTRAI